MLAQRAGRKQGKWESFYESGRKFQTRTFKDDREIGTSTSWHETGQKYTESMYGEDGKPNGTFTTWYKNGHKSEVSIFKSGKQDGTWTMWHENGQKRLESIVKGGVQVGSFNLWHENGKIAVQHAFKDGKIEGPHTAWYENGQKAQLSIYKGDKRNGPFTSWYENGQRQQEGTMRDNKENGLFTTWYKSGNKKSETTWMDGKEVPGTRREWVDCPLDSKPLKWQAKSTGGISMFGCWKGILADPEWPSGTISVTFNRNGRPDFPLSYGLRGEVKVGNRVGTWQALRLDESKIGEGDFQAAALVNWRLFYPNGRVKAQGSWAEDRWPKLGDLLISTPAGKKAARVPVMSLAEPIRKVIDATDAARPDESRGVLLAGLLDAYSLPKPLIIGLSALRAATQETRTMLFVKSMAEAQPLIRSACQDAGTLLREVAQASVFLRGLVISSSCKAVWSDFALPDEAPPSADSALMAVLMMKWLQDAKEDSTWSVVVARTIAGLDNWPTAEGRNIAYVLDVGRNFFAKESLMEGLGLPPERPEPVSSAEQGSSASVGMGMPAVDGELDPALVSKEVRDRIGGIKACYVRALKQRPTLSGEIDMGWTITAAGIIVGGATIKRDTVGDAELSACIIGVLARWRFRAPAAGSATVVFPLVLKAGP